MIRHTPDPQSPYRAVLTGDVVQSTRLSSEKFKDVQEILRRASDDVAQFFPGRAPFPTEVFRGDSWQLLVTDPTDALRIALFVRAYLRADTKRVDTRISIGVGTVDTQPTHGVGEGRGEAFRLSGELLAKRTPSRMRFAMTKAHPDSWWQERSVATILAVLDLVVLRWTSAQALAIRGALVGWKQERIAESWPGGAITQQAAAQHLARAGWDGVREAVAYYEEIMRKWLSA